MDRVRATPPRHRRLRGRPLPPLVAFGYNNPVIKIAPSILSADFAALATDIARVEAGGAHHPHPDCIDGRVGPQITIGPLVGMASPTKKPPPPGGHLRIIQPPRH